MAKLEQFGNQVIITDKEDDSLNAAAINYLNQYKFYSISERSKLARLAKTAEERELLLNSFEKANLELVNKVLEAIKFYSDYDLNRCNKVLESFSQNLKWDIGFMMTILEIPFRELDKSSHSDRGKILKEIFQLIANYKDKANSTNSIETYDI